MDITENFYLTLPSNSSEMYFPDNAASCFVTYLPREIQLTGDRWNVGLVDIYIPNTVQHLEDTETRYTVDGTDDESYELKPGVYKNLIDFLAMLNNASGIIAYHKFEQSSMREGYYAMKRICDCDMQHNIMFHDKTNRILGFGEVFALSSNNETRGQHAWYFV